MAVATDGDVGLGPVPAEWPVSKRINSVKAPPDDRTLIAPITLTGQNTDLFGNAT
jgi:hypothetical protein